MQNTHNVGILLTHLLTYTFKKQNLGVSTGQLSAFRFGPNTLEIQQYYKGIAHSQMSMKGNVV